MRWSAMPMMSWSLSVQVTGGPNLLISVPPEPIEAIDRITVDIGPGEDKLIDLQPGVSGQLRLLVIESSKYADEVSFFFENSGGERWPTSPATVALNIGPQVYSTSTGGLIAINPHKIGVKNSTGESIEIRVFVARDATA